MQDLKPNRADWRERNKVTGGKSVRDYDVTVEIIGCVGVSLCSGAVFLIPIG